MYIVLVHKALSFTQEGKEATPESLLLAKETLQVELMPRVASYGRVSTRQRMGRSTD